MSPEWRLEVVGSETRETPSVHTEYLVDVLKPSPSTPTKGAPPSPTTTSPRSFTTSPSPSTPSTPSGVQPGTKYTISRRYSDFHALFTTIEPNLAALNATSSATPVSRSQETVLALRPQLLHTVHHEFPVKKWMGRMSSSTISSRKEKLNSWIQALAAVASLSEPVSIALSAFLKPTTADLLRSNGNRPILLPPASPLPSPSNTPPPTRPRQSMSPRTPRTPVAALVAACSTLSVEKVDKALSVLPSISGITDEDGGSLGALPVRSGSVDVLKRLLAAGLDPNGVDADGDTLLVLATERPQLIKVLEALIEGGADVALAVNGMSPLHHAAWHSNTPAIKALLGAGADVRAKSATGHTPLLMAVAYCNGLSGPVEALLGPSKAANVVKVASESGETALSQAKLSGWTNVVELLERE